jgi:hypothetical protein
MIEALDIGPGPDVMACFASQESTVAAPLGHAILEFAVVHVFVAGCAAHILKMEREDFVGPASGSNFVAIGASHGSVCSSKGETGVAMLRDRKSRAMEIQNRMAILATIQIRSGSELTVVRVLMAIGAGREFHLENRVFARRKMALRTFNSDVFAAQGVLRAVVLLHAKE